MRELTRRRTLLSLAAIALAPRTLFAAAPSLGERLALAARKQIGVTRGYDPAWTKIAYPNGDVPRSTGVCADVVIRAARDAFQLDLQKLVHEDMTANFAAYPSVKKWGERRADANIDHRRVLNLEAFWRRQGCQIFHSTGKLAGDAFPSPAVGDLLTWLLWARLPHVAIVVDTRPLTVVHNIGGGAELCPLASMREHEAQGLYRWPKSL